MEREPQFKDRVELPDGAGDGEIVAMSQTVKGWYIGVKPDRDGAPLWKGYASGVKLLEAAGEDQVLNRPKAKGAAVKGKSR
jgi:hypothetical protein